MIQAAQELSHGEGKLQVMLRIPLWSKVPRKSLVLPEDVPSAVSRVGVTHRAGGRAHPSSGCRKPGPLCGVPDPLLESSQSFPHPPHMQDAHYGTTRVGWGLGRGCGFSADADAEAGPVAITLGLLTQHWQSQNRGMS